MTHDTCQTFYYKILILCKDLFVVGTLVQRGVGFGLNVGGTEFSVNNTPTILGFVGMSMKSHLWCYEILEHIKGVGGAVNTKVCVFL